MSIIPHHNKFRLNEWRRSAIFPDYEVSSDGRIASHKSNQRKLLKPWFNADGYKQASLNGAKYYVHRLVLFTFLGLPLDPDYVADHLNFDRSDNRIENLRWLPRHINAARKASNTHD